MANFSKPQNMMGLLVAFFALLQVSVASQHGARHHEVRRNAEIKAHIDEVGAALEKRDIGPYLSIQGVCSIETKWWGDCDASKRQSYPRLEIRQLRQNADQWNLYLIGMERFQAKSKDDKLSYYQVAGVHGRPFTAWNNFPTPLLNQAGFCPHSQALFGSWHRPYLAIFEQAWYLSVVDVIAEFPSDQQQRWKRAAATLRMPYWDWAMDPGNGQPTVPTAIRDQQVTVIKPSGEQTINNPLYSYTWGDSLPSEIGGGPWDSFPKTLRRPVAGPTRSNNNEMAARFDNMRISLRDRVFALFSSKQPWGFATTSAIGVRTDLSGSGVDSFESVHDAIHNTAGGESGGHMYYLDMSAFDPIFWLHHTNIDRLTNMYQYIVPNSYVANGNINHPMAQWNEGEPKNSYTPLKPFTKGTYGEYYTSEDVRETRVLGYYYPETSDRSYGQVAQAVTRLYGAGVRSITKRSVLGDIVDDVVDTVGDIVDGTTKKTSQYLGRQFREGDYHTVLTVTADKFAMEGGYTVHCFIGDKGNSTSNSTAPYTNGTLPHSTGTSSSVRIPLSTSTGTPKPSKNSTSAPEADYDPSKDFTNDPNYVGAYGVLGGMKPGGHNSSYPVITRGSLPLTTCLMGKQAAGLLSSLKPTDIEAYLQKNLYYKVIGVNGELDPTKIPSFHVSVGCTKVTPAKNEFELPDLSKPYEILPKATEHLPAGKPFTYVPTPNDIPLPNASYGENGSGFPGSNNNNNGNGYPSMPSPVAGVKPYPTSGAMPLPWQESGYCVTEQTIRYVYPDGKAAAY